MNNEESFPARNTKPRKNNLNNLTLSIIWLSYPILSFVSFWLLAAMHDLQSFVPFVSKKSASVMETVLMDLFSYDYTTFVMLSKLVEKILLVAAGISLLFLIIGIPLSIMYFVKYMRRRKEPQPKLPENLSGWNWGAAGLGIIWGIYNRVWISFLGFIPLVGSIWWIVMGYKGNEWAWQSKQWGSLDEFKTVQNKWNKLGLIVFIVMWALSIFLFIFRRIT
ncbi:MAG: hypothetical protein ABIH21_00755 [Patescibacteria group bacterium]